MKRIVVCCDGKIWRDVQTWLEIFCFVSYGIRANAFPIGTWLDASMGLSHNGKLPIPSNVTRISEAIKPVSSRGIQQVVFYQAGSVEDAGQQPPLLSC